MSEYDIIIVGGGIVAFASAIYAGRLHLSTLIIGEQLGGTIVLADKVENYPGFASISGQDLFDSVRKHAEGYGPTIREEKVDKVEKKSDRFIVTSGAEAYSAKTVLISTGTEWRKLNIPGEKQFTGNGVHYCALCDGYIYQDKMVAVIGGSDSAASEALLLADTASKVYLLHRADGLSAEPVMEERLRENKKIELIAHSKIIEIKGKETVDHLIFEDSSGTNRELALDAVFIDVGHVPTSALCQGLGVKLNDKQQIIVDAESKTNIPGVFAAGDVTNTRTKQSITGVAQGVSAVYSAYQYLKGDAPKKIY
jgi:thioredoxin-disulfide reductase